MQYPRSIESLTSSLRPSQNANSNFRSFKTTQIACRPLLSLTLQPTAIKRAPHTHRSIPNANSSLKFSCHNRWIYLFRPRKKKQAPVEKEGCSTWRRWIISYNPFVVDEIPFWGKADFFSTMSNIPSSLSDVCLTQFRLAMSTADPWPFSWKNRPRPKHIHQPILLSLPLRSKKKKIMRRTSRGFHFPLGRKMVRLWKWIHLKPKQKPSTRGYIRLNEESSWWSAKNKTMTKICNWGRCLRKRLCSASKDSTFNGKAVAAPKGHLAVYVGEKEDDTHRYLVPVIYFNHPLFAELLREAEDEYGFQHPGGIKIPCRVAEFESVRTRIAGERGRQLARRLRFPWWFVGGRRAFIFHFYLWFYLLFIDWIV